MRLKATGLRPPGCVDPLSVTETQDEWPRLSGFSHPSARRRRAHAGATARASPARRSGPPARSARRCRPAPTRRACARRPAGAAPSPLVTVAGVARARHRRLGRRCPPSSAVGSTRGWPTTSVAMPPTLIGLARSADPAIQSQVAQLATDVPSGFTHRRSAGYVGDSSTLLVVAAKPQHVLTLAEQESLTRSFWAQAAASVPDGSSLAAPSTPRGRRRDGHAHLRRRADRRRSATCASMRRRRHWSCRPRLDQRQRSDPTAPAQVPPAVVHAADDARPGSSRRCTRCRGHPPGTLP